METKNLILLSGVSRGAFVSFISPSTDAWRLLSQLCPLPGSSNRFAVKLTCFGESNCKQI